MNIFLPFSFHVRRAQMSNGIFIHAPGPKSAYGFAEALFYKIMGNSGLDKIKSIRYCAYDIEMLGEESSKSSIFSMQRVFSKDDKKRRKITPEALELIEQAESRYEHAPIFQTWTPWVQQDSAGTLAQCGRGGKAVRHL